MVWQNNPLPQRIGKVFLITHLHWNSLQSLKNAFKSHLFQSFLQKVIRIKALALHLLKPALQRWISKALSLSKAEEWQWNPHQEFVTRKHKNSEMKEKHFYYHCALQKKCHSFITCSSIKQDKKWIHSNKKITVEIATRIRKERRQQWKKIE